MTLLNAFFKFRGDIVLLFAAAYLDFSVKFLRRLDARQAMLGACFASLAAFVYLFNKLHDSREDAVNTPENCLTARQWKILACASALAFMAPLAYLFRLGLPRLWGPYLGLGALNILYSLPLGENRWRLKKFPLSKAGVTMLNGFWIIVMAPILAWHPFPWRGLPRILLGSIPLFLIIFGTAVLLDIRDMEGDRDSGNRTIPLIMGAGPAAGMVCLLMLAACLPVFWPAGRHPERGLPLIVAAFALGAPAARGSLYYHGLILAQCAALLLCLP
ncbi:MAG: UbiA family prenyltransferase [Elusimicrobia bacterium]|nr:UbiA family prenyltransferase [Elusimicrobiota bacterium]